MTAAEMARLHSAGFTETRPWTEAEFAALLDSPTTFLIPRPDRAFALGRAMGGEAELLTLVTHPSHRRQGLARECLLGFEAEARARFAKSAFLEVAEDNDPARQLYDRAGYRGVGERPAYYPRANGPVAALVLSKTLA